LNPSAWLRACPEYFEGTRFGFLEIDFKRNRFIGFFSASLIQNLKSQIRKFI
jgi:hypothetical protein